MSVYLKKIWQEYHWLILLSVIFLVVYCFLNFSTNYHFNTPDEVQYFNFAKNYVQTGQMSYQEPLNEVANGLIKPRWAVSNGGQVVPGIVVGFPFLYGLVGKLFGWQFMLYLTPILAIIGVWFFYFLIKYIFEDKKIALISAILLFVQPAWWYYASRTMFNNIAFLTFLLFGIYFLLQAIDKKRLLFYCLFGLGVGLALITRLTEVVWVFVLVVTIVFLKRQKVSWFGLILSFLSFSLIFSILLFLNWDIYGNFFNFGYNLNSISSGSQLDSSQGFFVRVYHLFKLALIPFGFSLKNIILNFKDYILQFFWPIVLFFLLGLCFVIKKWSLVDEKKRSLIWISLSVGGLLLLSYGSWYFADVISGSRVTIGSSYFRYFLPIYILMLPWVTVGLLKIKRLYFGRGLLAIALMLYLIFCFKIVYFDIGGGLFMVKKGLADNQKILEKVDQLTEKDAVFITGPLDKAIYPEKKVIFALQKAEDYQAIKNLVQLDVNVYQFILTSDVTGWLENNQIKFKNFTLKLENIQNIGTNIYLAKVVAE